MFATKFFNFVWFVYGSITILSPKPFFLALMNLSYVFKRIPDRLSWSEPLEAYRLRTINEQRFFIAKFQNYNSFKDGLRKRNLRLVNDYLLKNLHINSDDLVVDCGANIGDFYFALNYLYNGFQYVAFEPSPQEFKMLDRNIGRNGQCYNIGLWSKEETLPFYTSNFNADSSFIEPDKHTNIYDIQAKRMDQILTKNIKLLKLEAEGAEMQVLLGMGSLLNQCEYITADLGFENRGKSTLPEVTNYLLQKNFKIIDFGAPRIVVLFKNTFGN
jgi:FkbM family methyltransferase